jgi:AcrR family transcriptional regulator
MPSAPAPTLGLRERSKQRRTQQILESTRELLREEPDRSPSVERIAARAEVAPATVFNLVGPRERIWAALANEAIGEIERRIGRFPALAPQERARRIVAASVDIVCSDPRVYRHVLAHWTDSAQLLRREPTPGLVACLREAGSAGIAPEALAENVATACTGALHQWAGGLIGERRLRDRCRLAVDVAFAAARAS